MRHSGRTTRMLLDLASYISEHWDEDKLIILTAQTVKYAWILARKLNIFLFLGDAQRSRNIIQFGEIKIVITSHSLGREIIKRYRFDAIFSDHYYGG